MKSELERIKVMARKSEKKRKINKYMSECIVQKMNQRLLRD